MERGTAHINNGVGRIDASTAPTPVAFAPGSFPDIVDDEAVYFERVSSNPGWASQVVRADDVNGLLEAAIPRAGLTRSAHALMLRKACQFVAEAQVAPSSAHRRAHLSFAKKAMKRVAALDRGDGGRLGIAAVRGAFA